MGPSGQDNLDAEMFQRICRSTSAALIATDCDARITYWNPAATALLGPDQQDILGEPLEIIIPGRHRREFRQLLTKTLETGAGAQFEIVAWTAARGRTPILATVACMSGPDGQAEGLVVWMVDQSQSMQMAKQLAKTERMASLGTLAGGVAHDFNNILGGVGTFVDYALTSDDDVVMRRALQMTAEAVARGTKLTSSLLTFAEQDSGDRDMADFTEALLTFIHLVEPTLAERGITLTTDLGPVPVTPVSAMRIQQVFRRVLANAEEAMPDGGTITIHTAAKHGHIILTITDTGVGIAADVLSQIAEPFFTTKDLLAGGGGSNEHIGLGLSVVHAIVADMGGRLTISSKDRKGTEVRIILPAPDAGSGDI